MTNLQNSILTNLKERKKIVLLAEQNPEFAQKIREMCERDIHYWINLFCWTKDPKRPYDKVPFVLYPFQEVYVQQLLEGIEGQKDLLTEKSREMGVSWLVLYVFTHYWLYKPNSDFRVGSRKEDFVDKLGDMDTLLEKIRFCLRYMPSFLLPKGYDETLHAGRMRIINPENGNTIIGESANAHFGSGGRRKAILLDEFAKWDESISNAAWTATADVTKCRLPVSTPVGSGNKFAELAMGTKEKIAKATLHWTLHPEKNIESYYLSGSEKILVRPENAFQLRQKGIEIRSPWYDYECERRSPADIAQELDIDYLRSGYPYFSIEALRKQQVWKFTKRKFLDDPIPYGFYVRGKLLEFDNKIKFVENEHENWLRVFELPKDYMQYAIGADTSEGLAKGDESFAVVRDKYTRNVVATISGLLPPETFTLYLFLLGKYYNDADVAPENNNMGYGVCKDLESMGCRLYYAKKDETKQGEVTTRKRGYTTTATTRPMILAQAAEELRNLVCEVRDDKVIQQMETFVKDPDTGIPKADGRFLDDGVMAFAIAGQIITELPLRVSRTSDTIRTELVAKRQQELRNAGFKF